MGRFHIFFKPEQSSIRRAQVNDFSVNPRVWLLAFVAFFVAGFGPITSGSAFAQTEQKEATKQEQEKEGDHKKGTQEKEFKGTEDFEKATELKVSAKTLRDLDEIASLCRSAIQKGLDKDTKEFCETMLVDTLMLYAKTASDKVLIRRDRRWQFLRREGLKRLREIVELRPKRKIAWMLIARLNVIPGGDRDEVASAVEKLIEIAGDDSKTASDALVIRSTIAASNKERLEDLEQAIDLMPENVGARRARGMFFLAQKKNDKAIADFKYLVEKDPKDIRSALILAEIYYREKKHDESLEVLGKLETAKNDPRPVLLKANVLLQAQRFDEAVKAAKAALQINSRSYPARVLLVRALLGAEKNKEVIEESNRLIAANPRDYQGRWFRSIAYAAMEKYDEAIDDVTFLTEQVPAPGNAAFMLQLGSLYNASERPRKAIEHFTQMLDDYPNQKGILRSRGDAYLAIGKHQEAIADYKKQLKTTPEDFGTLNNLAWVLSTSPEDKLRDGKKALEYAEKACKLTDHSKPYILSTLASCYAETGDFDNALKWIKKAKELAEKEKSDNLKDIIKELKFYEEKKPWREKEDVKEKPFAKKKTEKKKTESKKEEEDDDDDDF